MVRATIFVSALFALAATVSAIPRPFLVGELTVEDSLKNILNKNTILSNNKVKDVLDVNVLTKNSGNAGGYSEGCDDNNDCDKCDKCEKFSKREEAPAGTVRIARQNKKGKKMMNNKSKKAAAAAAAAVKMA